MKVKVIERFKDLKEGVIREKGDTFDVSKERYKELNSVLKLVVEVAEETKPTASKSTVKKRGAKK
jgi:Ni,Fe-hydrogenase III large subunit